MIDYSSGVLTFDLHTLPPGHRLAVARAIRGIKLWELAARIGTAQGRISELENGRRRGRAIEWQKICTALEMPDLLTDDERSPLTGIMLD